MIKIRGVQTGKELLLETPQVVVLDGKNRIMINDYYNLKMQLYGGKLSPLKIEGFFEDYTKGNEFIKTVDSYFENTKVGKGGASFGTFKTGSIQTNKFADPLVNGFGEALDQFIIEELVGDTKSRGSDETSSLLMKDTLEGVFKFVGVLSDYTFYYDINSNGFLNYSIGFLVYPYPVNKNNKTRIADAYFVSPSGGYQGK